MERENILHNLCDRIKGSRIYSASSGERLYIPYYVHHPYIIKVRAFLEVINTKVQLFVRVSSDIYTQAWCKQESFRIKAILNEQLSEVICSCEREPYIGLPHMSLLDNNIQPVLSGSTSEQAKAIRFLCQRKVALLISEDRGERWTIALRIAESRHTAKKIDRLLVFLPGIHIEKFREAYVKQKVKIYPIIIAGIERLSHNFYLYKKLLDYTGRSTMIIADDCHLFKSPDSLRSKRIMVIARQCNYKLLMTASLVTNNIHDVYMPYNILDERILCYYRWEYFSKIHIIYGGVDGSQILGYKNIAYLISKLEPYTYSINRIKPCSAEVQSMEMQIYCCELTTMQKYYYANEKQELLSLIEEDRLSVYDIFRIFIRMQKIVCGYPLDKDKYDNNKIYETNKKELLKENLPAGVCVIFCKFRFEIDLLLFLLGEKNCRVINNKCKVGISKNEQENAFLQEKYFLSTLYSPESKLQGVKDFTHILFFSLSFCYTDYLQCFSYISDNGMGQKVSFACFATNSGIDHLIIQNLKRKGMLATELRDSLANKSRLARLVEIL
ncbi:MAG: hypothetical protein LBV71_03590 [Prevotella sp.]|jgi:hypothetical protein|nr:hypothetical protein [Prevotella sp.]